MSDGTAEHFPVCSSQAPLPQKLGHLEAASSATAASVVTSAGAFLTAFSPSGSLFPEEEDDEDAPSRTVGSSEARIARMRNSFLLYSEAISALEFNFSS